MESVKSNKIIYVNPGNFMEFQKYVAERVQPGVEFLYIQDEYFLRGRVPGEIVSIGTYADRWDAHGIDEAITRYRELWNIEIQKDIDSQDIEYGEVD